MALRLVALLLFAALAGCSSTQWKAMGSDAVRLVYDVLRRDNGADAEAWVPAYQRCDALCESRRAAASAQVADEHERRLQRERRERTSEAFEEFMDNLDTAGAAALAEQPDQPVVIVDARRVGDH